MVLIPILNGASITGSQIHASRVRRSNPRKTAGFISWPTVTAFLALTIYETVIATLALTHMVSPDDLTCGLQRQWNRLYSNKDATSIRRIQDAHQCCGLVTAKDHAWPFQDKNNKADACITAFDRHKGCLLDWRQDEQIYAGLLLLVALSAIGLKVCLPFIANLDLKGRINHHHITSSEFICWFTLRCADSHRRPIKSSAPKLMVSPIDWTKIRSAHCHRRGSTRVWHE